MAVGRPGSGLERTEVSRGLGLGRHRTDERVLRVGMLESGFGRGESKSASSSSPSIVSWRTSSSAIASSLSTCSSRTSFARWCAVSIRSRISWSIWNAILVGAGYILAEHYELVETFLDPLTILVIAAVVLLYLFRVVTWRPSRAK